MGDHGHRQQCSNGQREVGGWVEGQSGEMGPSVIESTIKIKIFKKEVCEFMCPHLCFQQIKFGCIDQSHRAMFPWLLKAGINSI